MWPCFCPRTVPPGPADFYLRPVDLHPQLALPELHPCLTPHIPGVNTISNLLTDGQWQVFSGLSGFLLLFFSSCLTFPHVYKVSSCFVRFSSCFVRVSHVTFIIWRSLPMSPWFGLACFRWLSVTVNLVRFPHPLSSRSWNLTIVWPHFQELEMASSCLPQRPQAWQVKPTPNSWGLLGESNLKQKVS